MEYDRATPSVSFLAIPTSFFPKIGMEASSGSLFEFININIIYCTYIVISIAFILK